MGDMQLNYRINLGGNISQQAERIGSAISSMSKRSVSALSGMSASARALGTSMDAVGKKMETTAKYATVAAGAFAAWQAKKALQESAQLDKALGAVKRTAGATAEQAGDFRKQLMDMSAATGQSVESLVDGSQKLVAVGLSWDSMAASMQSISETMAVSDANAEQLASALNATSKAFNFDISNPKIATELLDKMYVAGNAGSAELQDLSEIFARVGLNAKQAGMSYDDTLAFIEVLSNSGVSKDTLGTLADSTLRLFTNFDYLKKAEKGLKGTGIKFFDAKGQKRSAQDVMTDISNEYKKLKTDLERDKLIDAAFGETDQDTKRGIKMLLADGALGEWTKIRGEIEKAGGAVKNNLGDALNNSIDQTARLKNTLRESLDTMSKPINNAISGGIKTLLDEKKVSGDEMLAGGGMAAILGLGGLLVGGKAARGLGGKLAGKFGGLAAGVATGKALEAAGGATPVYVVNMPNGGMGGGGGGSVTDAAKAIKSVTTGGVAGAVRRDAMGVIIEQSASEAAAAADAAKAAKSAKMLKAGKMLGAAGMVAGAGVAGWEAGSYLYENYMAGGRSGDAVGSVIARTLALFGNKEAQESLDRQKKYDEAQKLDVKLHVTSEGQAQVESVTASKNTQLEVGNTTGVHS